MEATAKFYLKGFLPAILGVAAAALGTYAVGAFRDHFTTNPFFASVAVSKTVSVDWFGAGFPLALSVVAAVLFLGYFKLPAKRLAVALIASVSLAFLLSRLTSEGVAGSPLLFALASSAVAVAVNVLPNHFGNMSRGYVGSVLAAVCSVPLSLLAVDLFYLHNFANPVIGGSGLNDGVLLSTLYAPMGATMVASVVVYVSQMAWLVKKQRLGAKTSLPQIKPVMLESQSTTE